MKQATAASQGPALSRRAPATADQLKTVLVHSTPVAYVAADAKQMPLVADQRCRAVDLNNVPDGTRSPINDRDGVIPSVMDRVSFLMPIARAMPSAMINGHFRDGAARALVLIWIPLRHIVDASSARKTILRERDRLLGLANAGLRAMRSRQDLCLHIEIATALPADAGLTIQIAVDMRKLGSRSIANSVVSLLAPSLERLSGGMAGPARIARLAERHEVHACTASGRSLCAPTEGN